MSVFDGVYCAAHKIPACRICEVTQLRDHLHNAGMEIVRCRHLIDEHEKQRVRWWAARLHLIGVMRAGIDKWKTRALAAEEALAAAHYADTVEDPYRALAASEFTVRVLLKDLAATRRDLAISAANNRTQRSNRRAAQKKLADLRKELAS